MSELTSRVASTAERVVHLTLTPESTDTSSLTGVQVTDILHSLSRNVGNAVVESVTFRDFRIVGVVELNRESAASVVPHITFAGCQKLEIHATNCAITSITITHCTIAGVSCRDANLAAGLSISNSRIENETVEGKISAIDLGGLDCKRLSLEDMQFADRSSCNSISLAEARVGAIYINGLANVAFVDLASSRVAGRLDLRNIGFTGTPSGIALDLSSAQIGADVTVSDVQIAGTIQANNVEIGSHFYISNTTIDVDSTNCHGQTDAIHAEGARINGALLLHGLNCAGRIYFLHANVGVNIEFKRCVVSLASTNSGITLTGSLCRGDLLVFNCNISGGFNIPNIGAQSIYLHESAFLKHSQPLDATPYAIYAVGIRTKGLLHLRTVRVLDRISFSDSSVGELEIESLIPIATPDQSTMLTSEALFERIEVRSKLFIGKIVVTEESLLSFRDSVCHTLALAQYQELKSGELVSSLLLDLNGLRYSNIDHMESWAINKARSVILENELKKRIMAKRFVASDRAKASKMAEVVKLVVSSTKSRQPRSHTQLARVLKEHGWDREANEVLWQMRRIMASEYGYLEGTGWRKIFRIIPSALSSKVFDLMFGYGYSKFRATFSIFCWVALGWYGVEVALDRGVLVVDPAYVAIISDASAGQGAQASLLKSVPSGDISCHGVIKPLFYAIDLLVPVMDFGQVKKCGVGFDSGALRQSFFARESTAWFAAQYVYTIAGWIIVSFAALTFTGSLREKI